MTRLYKEKPNVAAGVVLAALVTILLTILPTGAGPVLAGGGDGYNTVTVFNCTKGDGAVSFKGTNDIGVLDLTMKSYNAWDDSMTWAFTAVGQTGVVQNVDPGESATLNCLQKETWFSSTSHNACKVRVTKSSFPDTLETLSNGGTYYFTGLTTVSKGQFSTTRPGYCK